MFRHRKCSKMHIFALILLALSAKSVAGDNEVIRMKGIEVPDQQAITSNASLKCLFELGPTATLYSVKWYKDGAEFYRYLPGVTPPAQAFSLPGVTVDLAHSDAHQVILQSLQSASSGVYECEVSTEAPFFHTVSEEALLTVTASSTAGGPRIWGLRGLYTEGDIVDANCTSPPSKPVSNITWYMNDKKVPQEWLVKFGKYTTKYPINDKEFVDLDVATVGLRLPASHTTFPKRVLKLRCMAQLGDQQWQLQRWTFLINHQVPHRGNFKKSRAAKHQPTSLLPLVLMVILFCC
ncbi:uncharacterized protein [Periplaneta americana]|uniref:uncharacterized protein n=1 Tax=Periplaneta americana TaxID=6978 RepID=UPI0037E78E25